MSCRGRGIGTLDRRLSDCGLLRPRHWDRTMRRAIGFILATVLTAGGGLWLCVLMKKSHILGLMRVAAVLRKPSALATPAGKPASYLPSPGIFA
jgi:hypothetical protein